MASRSSNRAAVPEAKAALDKFKYEVASELGVPLKEGYNGDLTAKEAGSIGGEMVKRMVSTPILALARAASTPACPAPITAICVSCFIVVLCEVIIVKFRGR